MLCRCSHFLLFFFRMMTSFSNRQSPIIISSDMTDGEKHPSWHLFISVLNELIIRILLPVLKKVTFCLAKPYLSPRNSLPFVRRKLIINKHNWIFRIRLAENSRLEVFSMCPCDRYTVYDECRKQKRWSPKGDNTALFFSDSQLEFKEAPWTSRQALPWKQRLQTCQPARRPWRKGW